jgi:hypothetical protein
LNRSNGSDIHMGKHVDFPLSKLLLTMAENSTIHAMYLEEFHRIFKTLFHIRYLVRPCDGHEEAGTLRFVLDFLDFFANCRQRSKQTAGKGG